MKQETAKQDELLTNGIIRKTQLTSSDIDFLNSNWNSFEINELRVFIRNYQCNSAPRFVSLTKYSIA